MRFLQGEAEEEAARNTTLGNFICLLNPISWSIYWMIVRRGQKMRDAAKLSAPSGAAAAAAAVAANKEGGNGEPEAEERWWDEMLAIQIVTTIQRFESKILSEELNRFKTNICAPAAWPGL